MIRGGLFFRTMRGTGPAEEHALERITSAQNAKVKRVKELLAQSKARRKAGEFVCEGRRLCEEIPPELIREVWMS